MYRKRKTRVLLQVDFLTNKIYDVKEYSGDGKGIDVKVDHVDFLSQAEAEGWDIYYEKKRFVKRIRDPEEFHNKKKRLEQEIAELKSEERKVFSSYIGNPYSVETKINLAYLSKLKNDKKKALTEFDGQRIRRIRKIVQNKIKNANYKYYCSICMIIRNDNEYLEEWLKWHIGQGIEHFYLYDHGSELPVSKTIKKLDKEVREKVTVIRYGGKHDFAQHDAYNNCLKKFGKESRWIGFIDSDEMVRVKDHSPVSVFLKEFEEYAGVFIGWIIYNANGHRTQQNLPVRERFTCLSPIENPSGMGKVFVQPYCMQQMLTHNGFTVDGFDIVNENKEFVREGTSWESNLTSEKICIDHYYTKSYEEWVKKISRGTCDPYFCRKYQEFFKHNPDLEDCREDIYPVQLYESYRAKEKIKDEGDL